ncbi:hypothetical protein RYX36_022027 [Vicia faba]
MENRSPSFNHNLPTQSSSDKELDIPIRYLTRIMQRALPPHGKMSDGSKESIQLCLSKFTSIVMSEANQRCKVHHRKIVTAEDILWAMNKLGFEDYVGPLSQYLQSYRDH